MSARWKLLQPQAKGFWMVMGMQILKNGHNLPNFEIPLRQRVVNQELALKSRPSQHLGLFGFSSPQRGVSGCSLLGCFLAGEDETSRCWSGGMVAIWHGDFEPPKPCRFVR